jgi:hypothetical protein
VLLCASKQHQTAPQPERTGRTWLRSSGCVPLRAKSVKQASRPPPQTASAAQQPKSSVNRRAKARRTPQRHCTLESSSGSPVTCEQALMSVEHLQASSGLAQEPLTELWSPRSRMGVAPIRNRPRPRGGPCRPPGRLLDVSRGMRGIARSKSTSADPMLASDQKSRHSPGTIQSGFGPETSDIPLKVDLRPK